jgi:hypothetical protein
LTMQTGCTYCNNMTYYVNMILFNCETISPICLTLLSYIENINQDVPRINGIQKLMVSQAIYLIELRPRFESYK